MKVHFREFGCQEILHSMYRFFLTSRAMYVVLLNARNGNQGDRARYWLQNIRSFAPDAPVLLVRIEQYGRKALVIAENTANKTKK